MSSLAPKKQEKEKPTTMPHHKMEGHTSVVQGVLRLHGGRQIITCSYDGSLQVWDLESGTQVGETWMVEGRGAVNAIALSLDGKTVASGSSDGAVRMWNISTGKVIKKWTEHTAGVSSVCWSPNGCQVVSGSDDRTFRVWNVESGKTVLGPIITEDFVFVVGYSPGGKIIVTGGDGLKVWDANTGELLKTLQCGVVSCLAWTSDGKTLIVASRNKRFRKLDTVTWTETAVLEGPGHEGLIQAISLSPNERILASVSQDRTARLWNLENDQIIGPPLHHEDWAQCATFSVDGKFLIIGCYNGRIYTWDVATIIRDAGLNALLSDNAGNVVNKSVLSADATRRRAPKIEGVRRVPQGFFDDFSTSRDHHTATPYQPTHVSRTVLSWAQNFVSGVLCRRDGSAIRSPRVVEVPLTAGKPRNYHARKKPSASSSRPLNPRTAQQHNGATQSNSSSSQQAPATTTASSTSPAGTGTAAATDTISHPDITVRRAGWRARFLLWVNSSSQIMSSSALANQEKSVTKPHHKIEGHTSTIYCILGLPDKRQTITGSGDGSLRVWDLESGKQVGNAWKDEGSEFKAVLALALSPDGKTIASGGQGGTVRLWNIDTGKLIKKWTGDTDIVQSVGWSPDGCRVVNGSFNGAVRVWDVRSGETVLGAIETGQGNIVWAVRYSPDGKRIATGADGLQIWDANTGKLLKTLGITVACLAWASGGSLLIVGSLNKIRTFDTNTWTEIAVLDGHERLVSAISLSPNERVLASVSDDSTARLWNLKSNQLIGLPLHHECENAVDKSVLDADATRRRTTHRDIEGNRRVPQGFFDDFSTSRGHHTAQTATSHQPTNPLSWTQKILSGMLRRQDGSNVRLPPIVDVPLTAGKPRNYHARKKKPSASSSRPTKPPATQQQSGVATESNPSSSQQPSSTATAPTTPPVATSTAGVAGTSHDITIRQAGWRARFLLWVCCVPVQQAGS
ncbi:quinon protein alcohol dehydrogenase-like superfamily [Suillus placidus]|uniref:Quinon protein alcohol dehydrogenase-like superfamily n=1 Tax=Suillus placidus TaxID=48579 RepID=A0A9P7D6C7_9AGAM|nr:quinon protein alcohol dehydrogenase-like superfamily [Suillus placidus]